ncbi:MAG TPA: hypothetical protein VH639_09605 [Bryobacteraceae bacterium]|jgi:hypothetical protein
MATPSPGASSTPVAAKTYTPTGSDKQLSCADFEKILSNSALKLSDLLALIPSKVKDVWVPEVRIKLGFKFEWDDTFAAWHAHGHEPDSRQAGTSSAAASDWVARISCTPKADLDPFWKKDKAKMLMSAPVQKGQKPSEGMTYWATGKTAVQLQASHIKLVI